MFLGFIFNLVDKILSKNKRKNENFGKNGKGCEKRQREKVENTNSPLFF